MAQASVGRHADDWDKVLAMMDTGEMPPSDAKKIPTELERTAAATDIRTTLKIYEREHAGEPGRVTVRRSTSGEYAYAIRDLTGLDLKVGIDASSDSVGGGALPILAMCSSCRTLASSATWRPPNKSPITPSSVRAPCSFFRPRPHGPGTLRTPPHQRPLHGPRFSRGLRLGRAALRARSLQQVIFRRVVVSTPRGLGQPAGDASTRLAGL